jgi:hypothetical protein
VQEDRRPAGPLHRRTGRRATTSGGPTTRHAARGRRCPRWRSGRTPCEDAPRVHGPPAGALRGRGDQRRAARQVPDRVRAPQERSGPTGAAPPAVRGGGRRPLPRVKQAAVARGLVVAERHVYYVRKMLELANRRGLMPPANYQDSFDKPLPSRWRGGRSRRRRSTGSGPGRSRSCGRSSPAPGLPSPHLFAQVLLGAQRRLRRRRLRAAARPHDRPGPDADPGLPRQDDAQARLPALAGDAGRDRRQPQRPRAAPKDPEHADRVFLTEDGDLVARKTSATTTEGRVRRTARCDSIRLAFDDLLEAPAGGHDGTRPRASLRKLVADGFFWTSPAPAAEAAHELLAAAGEGSWARTVTRAATAGRRRRAGRRAARGSGYGAYVRRAR